MTPVPPPIDPPSHEQVLAETRAWVQRAVIGLNLCPFARGVAVKDQVRYVVCDAADEEALLRTLCTELQRLADTDAELLETTLLVHPGVLADFADFNDFLAVAEAAVDELGLDGVLQVASFHPQYQFDGTAADDVGNATNRSPWPTLHLLREESIDRAVAVFPHPEAIFEANLQTLDALGPDGWAALQAQCRADAVSALAAGTPDAAASDAATARSTLSSRSRCSVG